MDCLSWFCLIDCEGRTYMNDLLKPGVYRGGRAWANAWDLFSLKPGLEPASVRGAAVVCLWFCFESGGISFGCCVLRFLIAAAFRFVCCGFSFMACCKCYLCRLATFGCLSSFATVCKIDCKASAYLFIFQLGGYRRSEWPWRYLVRSVLSQAVSNWSQWSCCSAYLKFPRRVRVCVFSL